MVPFLRKAFWQVHYIESLPPWKRQRFILNRTDTYSRYGFAFRAHRTSVSTTSHGQTEHQIGQQQLLYNNASDQETQVKPIRFNTGHVTTGITDPLFRSASLMEHGGQRWRYKYSSSLSPLLGQISGVTYVLPKFPAEPSQTNFPRDFS